MKFYGLAYRNLDAKGRLILPPEFRDNILENIPEGYVVLTIFNSQIIGITPTQWAHLVEELDRVKAPSNDLEETKMLLFSNYVQAPVNKQGRIAIPAHLRQNGNIGTEMEVVIFGAGNRFEIRPKEEYTAMLHKKRDVSGELRENNINLGI